MDIGKVFTAGFNAYLAGNDIDEAVISKLNELCHTAN